MTEPTAITEASVVELFANAGAKTSSRSGRSEHYGAPRDFSFEVKGAFSNGLALHVVARQFNYREAWEMSGRVNDLVDVSLLRNGQYSSLPKGCRWFQGCDQEEEVDAETLAELVTTIAALNPKIFLLQELTGDL